MRLEDGVYTFRIGAISVDRWLDGDHETRARLTRQADRVASRFGRTVRLVDELSGACIYTAR